MVGSAGTHQPAESRSQACLPPRVPRARTHARTHERRRGVHLWPRLGPANSLSAVRVRGRRAVVKDVGVRPPNDGQAAADDTRITGAPRPPENERATRLPTPPSGGARRACRSPAPRARSAPPSAAASPSPSPLCLGTSETPRMHQNGIILVTSAGNNSWDVRPCAHV
jgi:hypothetical protein